MNSLKVYRTREEGRKRVPYRPISSSITKGEITVLIHAMEQDKGLMPNNPQIATLKEFLKEFKAPE